MILGKESEDVVTSKTGLNHLNSLTDTIGYSRINAKKHTVGNLMIYLAHINASMQITKLSSSNEHDSIKQAYSKYNVYHSLLY